MKTEYVNWFDKSVPIGTRKKHYINYHLHKGWPFYKTINYANTIFGKKPTYKEPDKSKFYPKKCKHNYQTINMLLDVRCTICGKKCKTCGDYVSFDPCTECGFYDYIGL